MGSGMNSLLLRSGILALILSSVFSMGALGQDGPPELPPRTVPPPVTEAPPAQPSASPQPGNQQGQTGMPANPSSQSASPLPAGQPANGEDSGRFVFKKEVQEVVLHATVVDEAGGPVTQLDRNAFTIFQNGAPEAITSFRREDVPVEIGILIDNSGSMRDKRAKINDAVLNLIRASSSQDEIFVVNFSQTPYLDQDFTSDVNLLQAALHQVSSRGSTALYDAVVASANHLQGNSHLSKKVLLVVTDGEDNMSRETLRDAIRSLQPSKGVIVYAIGITDEGLSARGRQELRELATATGGAAYFPQSLNDVDSITRAVAHDIRSQYILAFRPANQAGNGYRTLRVEAHAPGYSRLAVRTRTGYYPGEEVK